MNPSADLFLTDYSKTMTIEAGKRTGKPRTSECKSGLVRGADASIKPDAQR